MSDVEEYVKELVEQGITTEDGAPLKCRDCGSTEFHESYYSDGPYIEEINVTCKNCKSVVGHKAYGRWEII